jgi:hypothetical protein
MEEQSLDKVGVAVTKGETSSDDEEDEGMQVHVAVLIDEFIRQPSVVFSCNEFHSPDCDS